MKKLAYIITLAFIWLSFQPMRMLQTYLYESSTQFLSNIITKQLESILPTDKTDKTPKIKQDTKKIYKLMQPFCTHSILPTKP